HEQRTAWTLAVKRGDRRLCSNSHLMRRAGAEVDQFLGMAPRKSGVERTALMPVIRCGRSVASRERRDHFEVGDRAGPHAVADADKLSIPVRPRWHPHFKPNVGVRRWLDRAGHAAKRRQTCVSGCRNAWSSAWECWRLER